ncbi:apoptosis-associated speck-like protein containing a CARD [Neoarius graeffei]|uniref:apoptosis-associated speck-like protein containing a CARD n=1 Tax=Neoarius graeffei TaxID=443677 RepID=UPI00298BFE35|nr:apoptosis-associated speck-like protein containing a CARD [Neoarius graeffei]
MSGVIPVLEEVDQLKRPCGAVFIDQHVDVLIQKTFSVEPILDKLLSLLVITNEEYQEVKTEKTPQKQMRVLLNELIRAKGDTGKQILYKTLKEEQPLIMQDFGAA